MNSDPIRPPVAATRPHALVSHDQTRIDEYYWLRDDSRQDPEVTAYLNAENDYVRAVMAPAAAIQTGLFEELKSRIPARESGFPYRLGDWYYLWRFDAEHEHPVYLRRHLAEDAPDQVILDVDELARDHEFYTVTGLTVSTDGHLLAYGEDTLSREIYTLRIRNLKTGRWLDEAIENTAGDYAWANDNRTLFYVTGDPVTLRPDRIYRHRLGDDPANDQLVYHETDPGFSVSVEKSRDDRWIILGASATLSDEFWLIDADVPDEKPRCILARRPGHEYTVEVLADEVFFLSNWEAPNFRLLRASLESVQQRDTWDEVVPAREEVLLEDFTVFRNFVALSERSGASLKLRVIDRRDGSSRLIEADEPSYTMSLDANLLVDTDVLRYEYESLRTPVTLIDEDMASGEKHILKVEQVAGGYDPQAYFTEQLLIPARDGRTIPVSLLYAKGVSPDGSHPLFLTGYGAYGLSYDPEFSPNRLSLLDRGFVFAIAHVRGGQEWGRDWYDQGRVLAKKNTFNDFIDVSEYLLETGWCRQGGLVAHGGSAGGLLMGVIANQRPRLYSVIIADVPFVDAVTSMSDESIPLVTSEYDEWGDPRDPRHYEYMLSYSPYDQITEQDYPDMLVLAGFYDSRVQYWEPAKWVARLRARKTDDNLLLFRTNMEAGHFDAAGRFEVLQETALKYAFVFWRLGIPMDIAR
ncbi:MAG: S9 family peptidase [Gammaproteobacteria bacterium]